MVFKTLYTANNGLTQTYVLSGNATSLIIELWGEGGNGGGGSNGVTGGQTQANGGPISGTVAVSGGEGGGKFSAGPSAGGAGGAAPTGGDVNTAGNAGTAGDGTQAGNGGDAPSGTFASGTGTGGIWNGSQGGNTTKGVAPGGGCSGAGTISGCIDKYSGGGGSGAYWKKTYTTGIGAGTITIVFLSTFANNGTAAFTLNTGGGAANTTSHVITNQVGL